MAFADFAVLRVASVIDFTDFLAFWFWAAAVGFSCLMF